jgi:5-methylcytosine-specific restriction endonuclease McrA
VLDNYQRAPDHRESAAKRGYDRKWRILRRAYIARHPLCEPKYLCDGHPAADVDHIVPIDVKPELRLVESNLQSICRSCHNYKTRRIDPKTRRAAGPRPTSQTTF